MWTWRSWVMLVATHFYAIELCCRCFYLCHVKWRLFTYVCGNAVQIIYVYCWFTADLHLQLLQYAVLFSVASKRFQQMLTISFSSTVQQTCFNGFYFLTYLYLYYEQNYVLTVQRSATSVCISLFNAYCTILYVIRDLLKKNMFMVY